MLPPDRLGARGSGRRAPHLEALADHAMQPAAEDPPGPLVGSLRARGGQLLGMLPPDRLGARGSGGRAPCLEALAQQPAGPPTENSTGAIPGGLRKCGLAHLPDGRVERRDFLRVLLLDLREAHVSNPGSPGAPSLAQKLIEPSANKPPRPVTRVFHTHGLVQHGNIRGRLPLAVVD